MRSSGARGLHKPGSPLSDVSPLLAPLEPDLRDRLLHPPPPRRGLKAWRAAQHPPRNAPAGTCLPKGLSSAIPTCWDAVRTWGAPFSPPQSTGVPRQGGLCWKALCPTAAFWPLGFSVARNLWFWDPLCTKKLRSWESQGPALMCRGPLSKPGPCLSALMRVLQRSGTSPYHMSARPRDNFAFPLPSLPKWEAKLPRC